MIFIINQFVRKYQKIVKNVCFSKDYITLFILTISSYPFCLSVELYMQRKASNCNR